MGSNANLFARHTAFNYLSKMLPTAVSFIFTLIISNYLGPENYGIYNYLPAVLVGFVTLFGGEFINNLLWTFTARKKIKKLFKFIFGINLLIALVLFAALNLLGPVVMTALGISHQELVPIASIFLLLTPINTIMMTLFKGFSQFGKVLKAALIENAITLLFAVIFIIFLQMGLIGAFIARFIAIVTSLMYYYFAYRKLEFTNAPINLTEIKQYGGWNILASFVRNLNSQILTISIGILLNAATLGIYYLGQRITTIAITNISNTITEIMWSKNSENFSDKKLIGKQTSTAIKVTLLITIALCIPFLLVVPSLINWLFPKFIAIIAFIPLFLIYSIIQTQGPVTSIFNAINKTKNNMKTNFFDIALTIIITIPLTYFFGLTGMLIAYSIVLELSYLYIIYLLRREGIIITVIPKLNDIKEIFLLVLRTRK
ncbi:MAG: oligosaccharide flippase family protein [archaeon]|jgi:O-antigen/teichoic acid export membrane protein